jgi:hypothetical protein
MLYLTVTSQEVDDRKPVKDIMYRFKRASNLAKARAAKKKSVKDHKPKREKKASTKEDASAPAS